MILVTGTDTGVGKTYVTFHAVRYLRSRGINVCAFKIVETGCDPVCEDAEKLSQACGKELKPIYSFRRPLAPSVSADLEGVKVSVERIKSKMVELARGHEIAIFEGAGGILVPITRDYTFLDLARDLSMEVVIVALNRLGVINHTLLTLKACRCEGVRVRGVILNTKEAFDESVRTNYETLKKLADTKVLPFSSEKDASRIAEIFTS